MPVIRSRFQPALLIAIIFALAVTGLRGAAQQKERSAVPDRYKWDLTQIYPSDQAWRSAKEKLAADVPMLREFKGHLAESPQKLADALELSSRLSKELSRQFVYASMMSDQDTRVSLYQGMQ